LDTYDKQVQGRTVIEAGWADAGVIQPFNDDSYPEEIRCTGIALSLDHNPRYNQISAYWGAVNAVIESVRNIVAVGATPLAITDCLCFGNPEKPEQMGKFAESVRGIAEVCQAITLKDYPQTTLPIIAGNVSFYNESAQGAIPPSPMISCIGVLADVTHVLTYDVKQADTMLILVGERKDECGGSVYYQLHAQLGAHVPQPDLHTTANEIGAVHAAIQQGLILAAHDIADGGLAVALAEMSFKYELGVCVDVPGKLATEKKLFGETGGFILEVPQGKLPTLNKLFADYRITPIVLGKTTVEPRLRMNAVIDLPVAIAKQAWQNGLREKLIPC
jgi:phosphoribosylformylglycinamidine synthase